MLAVESGRAACGLRDVDHTRFLGLVTFLEARQFVRLNIRRQNLHALPVVDSAVGRLEALEVALVDAGEVDVHLYCGLYFKRSYAFFKLLQFK